MLNRRGPRRKNPEDKASIMVRISPRADQVLAALEDRTGKYRSDIIHEALLLMEGQTSTMEDELLEGI